MTMRILGAGFYGRIRTLADSIKSDEQYLENASLGSIQRKQLQESINRQKAELKKVRAGLKASKTKPA